MRTGSRKYHIVALLAACIGGGVLYAGESTPPDASPDHRLQLALHSQASLPAEQDRAFATLQFEIDFVDAALNRLGVQRRKRSLNIATDRNPVAPDFRDVLQKQHGHNDRNPSGPVGAQAARSLEIDDISQDFWRQFDELAVHYADSLEREERLLYGAVSSINTRPRPAEFRAASPLRSLSDGRVSGERSGAQRGASSFWAVGEAVASRTPRASLAVAELPGVGRMLDVRAGLHLHAIRNGSLSKAAESLFADFRSSLRSTPPSLSYRFFFDLSSSRRSCASQLAPDSAGAFSFSPSNHVAARLYERATPRFELIGVSV